MHDVEEGLRTWRRIGALLVFAAATVIVPSSCGGSTSPSVANVTTTPRSAPSSPSAAGGATGSNAPPSRAALQRDLLKYAECMRSDGVPNFPDPSAGGGFEIPIGSRIDRSSPVFKAAQAKCQKFLPGGGPPGSGSTTHPSAQWLAHMVKVAQCMRRHGISDFPDPRTSVPSFPAGGGVISDIDGVIFVFPSAIDTRSPAFTRAATSCGFPLHNH